MKRSDFRLILLFFLLCIIIFCKSYFFTDGYLSPDSTQYLKLARNLSEGRGLYINDLSNPEGKTYFAMWPCAYPYLIFVLSKITTLSVFSASKVLNIIFIALIFIVFRKLFKENAFWFGLIFLFNSVLETFTYTWSEVPFIFGLLCFSVSVFYYLFKGKNSNLWLALIFLSSLFLFISRYVGAFSFGIIALIMLYQFIKKRYKEAIKTFIVLSILCLILFAYLYHNEITNGYSTGLMRIDRRDNLSFMLKKILIGEFKEVILFNLHNSYKYLLIFLSLIIEIPIFIFILKKINKNNYTEGYTETKHLWKIFLFVGFSYWISIIIMRFKYQFDPIDFRFLCPSTFLFALAFLSYLLTRIDIKSIKYRLVYIFLFAMTIYYLPNKKYVYEYYIKGNLSLKQENIDYNTNIKNIMNKYSTIPSNSLVLFGNKHVNYLRNDISVFRPLYREPMQPFIQMILKNSKAGNIYIEIEKNLKSYNNDVSVVKFMNENSDKDFIKLR